MFRTSLWGLLVALLLGPSWSSAAEEAEPESLRELVERLESRVEELEGDAARDRAELDETKARLAREERRARSSQPAFDDSEEGTLIQALKLFDLQLGLATSYNFNFNNPNFDPQIGFPNNNGRRNNGPLFPAVQHNTFQIDQLHIGIDKRATAESRWGLDLGFLYGVSADPRNGSDTPRIQRAYASYLVDAGEGVEVRLGRWDTPVGAETIYVGENFNITRGLAWFYQPFNHDGLLISGRPVKGFSWKLGVANNARAFNFDNNNGKSGLAQIGWQSDEWLVRATYLVEEGPLVGHFAALGSDSERDLSHMLDFTAFWDPDDSFSFWVNGTWGHTDFQDRGDTETFLLSLAARKQLTSRVGAALRTEGALFLSDGNQIDTEGLVWLTGTIDYALSPEISLRAEVVYQRAFADSPSAILFINGAGTRFTKQTQVVSLLQLLFLF
ncbi:MAG: outer membrane beta-barrel protein [Myxococcota bacterium]